VGGAVYGNAGAFGSCIADIVPIVDVLVNGDIVSMDTLSCKFSYRESIFKKNPNMIILGTYFSLRKDDPEIIKQKHLDYAQVRSLTQPNGYTAGCTFRNPKDGSAGALIDKAGMKGLKQGGAVISNKHANFIVNEGNATATDITKLITQIKKRIKNVYGINLKLEIEQI